jgi:glucokinase
MRKQGVIGIDVGGTKTLFVLFDERFRLIEKIKVKTPARDKADFVRLLTRSFARLAEKASRKGMKVSAVGVGCAGSIDPRTGVVRSAANIPALENFSFRKELRKANIKVSVFNDVHAALYGEMKLGAAAGFKHVISIFIGTGIGGALAVDGHLYRGANGNAGDIGHYMLQPMGPLAGSDRHGVLDDVASRIAISGEAATLAAKEWAPYLLKNVGTDVREIKASALAKAIRAGDKAIEELVRSRAQIVGIVLSNLVDFLNPELVVLGGGLTEALPEIIRSEVASGIKTHATPNAAAGVQVVTAALKERAVATGAARLALDHGRRISARIRPQDA